MKKIIVAIPHSHTWFWTQTCIASLLHYPPRAENCEVYVVVVDNSPWSPSLRGITDTQWLGNHRLKLNLNVYLNHKSNKFHATALDCVVEEFEFDFLMALETDVMVLKPTWLQWFMNQMHINDFAVGAWHHEQFINPSCTLYRGEVLRRMAAWCKKDAPQDELRWGPMFEKAALLDANIAPAIPGDRTTLEHLATLTQQQKNYLTDFKSWIAGPFTEKRGWVQGTVLHEKPSGQEKGPGWYEPGQQLHHWATDHGYTYTVCKTTTSCRGDGIPFQTLYGPLAENPSRQMEVEEMMDVAETAHLWAGTRALDILKHGVDDPAVKDNTPMWLAREARFWRTVVPPEVQKQTLELIRKYGWYQKETSDRDRAAEAYVRECYRAGGVEW